MVTLSNITDTITALATLVGVVIASIGLSTWHKQLKGTTEYELARKLLLQVYRVREALRDVRRPGMMIGEAGGDIPADKPWEIAVYENRWKGVGEALAQFDATALECEVIWGKSIMPLQQALLSHVLKLRSTVNLFIRSSQGAKLNDVSFENMEKILYPGIDDDPYEQELGRTIEQFEQYVRPHLKR